jgi:hypothetical protein
MARKKPVEIIKEETPVVLIKKQSSKKAASTNSDTSNVIDVTEEVSETIVIEPVVINPWVSILESAETLYNNIDDQYQRVAENEVSSMLIMLSSVIKSLKKKV